jgi:hypothetical protein
MVGGKGDASFGIRLVVFERPLAPHRIAARWLDENHLRTQIGQQQATVTSYSAGEIENTQPGERARGVQFNRHFRVG